MKKSLQIIVAVISVLALLTFAGCSKFGTIKKAYEKAGYTYSTEDAEADKYLDEESDITIYTHVFSKPGVILTEKAIVFEFDCSKAEMEEYLNTHEVFSLIKGENEDIMDSKYINGKCVLLPLCTEDALNVFIGA